MITWLNTLSETKLCLLLRLVSLFKGLLWSNGQMDELTPIPICKWKWYLTIAVIVERISWEEIGGWWHPTALDISNVRDENNFVMCGAPWMFWNVTCLYFVKIESKNTNIFRTFKTEQCGLLILINNCLLII